MNDLSSVIEHEDHVYIPFRIETLSGMPYLVYYLEPFKQKMQWITYPTHLEKRDFKGALNWKSRSYLFYEMTQVEREFLSSDQEV